MPYYKQDLDGARSRWRSNLSRAMKRRALQALCPRCGRKGALQRVRLDAARSMRACRWADCRFEIRP